MRGETVKNLTVKNLVVACFATAVSGMPALAADLPTKAEPVPVVVIGGVFGELLGAYNFKDPITRWRQFSAGALVSEPEVGIGAGWSGRALIGYRWGVWDVALAGEWGSFRNGGITIATGGFSPASIAAKMQAYDLQLGYNTMFGTTATRLALGVRRARWDNNASDIANRQMFNNWHGTGPRFELTTVTPLAPKWSLQANAGVGVLFGRIDVTSTTNWTCTQCVGVTTTSVNLDGRLGIGYRIFPAADLVVGWKAEYWSRVNVAIQDTTGFGANTGTTGHVSHGPFASLKFGVAPQ